MVKNIRLGTFFSGLETPSVACKKKKNPTMLMFAAEKDAQLRELIRRIWNPPHLFDDADQTTNDWSSFPDVDALVGGPPCTPFAPSGPGTGLSHEDGSKIMWLADFWVLRTPNQSRPKLWSWKIQRL